MRLLRIADVKKMTGLSHMTIYRLIKKNEFPSPVKLTVKTSVWPESEVRQFIKKRMAERAA